MSLTRQFFREFHPLFRILGDPIGRHASVTAPFRQMFDDPFFGAPFAQVQPAMGVSEEGNQYLIETELPGVKKEDLDVRIGNGGRTVTIEGKVMRGQSGGEAAGDSAAPKQDSTTPTTAEGAESAAVTESQPKQLSVERANFASSAHFTRTVVLPHPVDPKSVSAQLTDGILTLRIPKAEEGDSVRVAID